MEKQSKAKEQKVKLWFEDFRAESYTSKEVIRNIQFRGGILKKIEDGFLYLETREEIYEYDKDFSKRNPNAEAMCSLTKATGKFKITNEMIPISRIIRVEVVL